MEKLEFNLSDANGSVVELEAEYKEDKTFTMSGHFKGGSAGQMIDRISPKTKEEKSIISFWRKNHLKHISEAQWEKFKSLVEIIKVQEKSDTNIDVEWSIVDDNKIVALAKHLKLTPKKANKAIQAIAGNRYSVGKEGTYLVCTDEEADIEAVENLKDYIEDSDIITAFNWDNLGGIEQYLGEKGKEWFNEALKESYESYVEDIKTEGDRLGEEMLEANIITEEEKENGEWEDEKEEKYIEYLVENAGDPLEYFENNFGKEEVSEIIKKNNLIDEDEVITEVIAQDGRGNILNRYDGKEYEETVDGITYYIYED